MMDKKIIVVIFTVLLMVGCNPTGKVVYNIDEIDLAINMFPNSALVHIAQEKGFFTEQGIKVNYFAFPTGKLALDALIGGGADMATTADVPIALAGLANQKIRVISTIEYSRDNIQVVARKDSDIEKPIDLKGKKVATTRGGGPLFFTYKFLEKNNLSISDIKLINLNPPDMITALIRKDIDAFIVFEPSPSIVRKNLGEDTLTIFSPKDLYGETWNIVVMEDFEKENKETIIKFIKALIKAEEFYNNNREESLDIVSEYSQVELELLKDILAKQNIGVVLNDLLVKSTREEAEWAIDQGLSTSDNVPDYRLMISSSYLEKLRPSSVNI